MRECLLEEEESLFVTYHTHNHTQFIAAFIPSLRSSGQLLYFTWGPTPALELTLKFWWWGKPEHPGGNLFKLHTKGPATAGGRTQDLWVTMLGHVAEWIRIRGQQGLFLTWKHIIVVLQEITVTNPENCNGHIQERVPICILAGAFSLSRKKNTPKTTLKSYCEFSKTFLSIKCSNNNS